ncbi:hypothetical protein ILUMI_15446 [Ignelater luminosus]|uniref:Transposable element P transposase-like GTP-binding insertion domain-containing protein n=1 Tax=Ignelater luminosus TaxID=2038154 RepID=A0A8K0G6V1_IGNLU|nr:hypothetical protein ILUMI_15446 [Ignelater luminosus]
MPKRRIVVGETEIIPLYDVPHMIKGIGNQLLAKNLIWHKNDKILAGKWKDIETACSIDIESDDVRLLPKITELHLNSAKIPKMKVSLATQVFSHTMAAAIAIMARNSKTSSTGSVTVEPRTIETTRIIKLFDSIFDRLDGGTFKAPAVKPPKGTVAAGSSHLQF